MRNVSINDRTTPSMSPLIKTEPAPSIHTERLQDQPIDFSTKVRGQTNLDDTPSYNEESTLRKVSNDSAIDCSEDTNDDLHSHQTQAATNTDLASEASRQQQLLLGHPRLPTSASVPMPHINTFLPQSSSMAGMGMFYPTPPVFPNFLPPGFSHAGPMWPNPMAAMMQQEATRKLISQAAANNKQCTSNSSGGIAALRPNFGGKQFFGKQDMMGMTPGNRTFPSIPFQNPASNIPDPSILAEALKSHEEMFTAYKQQVITLLISTSFINDKSRNMKLNNCWVIKGFRQNIKFES